MFLISWFGWKFVFMFLFVLWS